MSELKIGDNVIISKNSRYYNPKFLEFSNPCNMLGKVTIKEGFIYGKYYGVIWKNGLYNTYNETDLCIALPNNKLNKLLYPDYEEIENMLIPTGKEGYHDC
jgi:hypothetical protein